MNRTCVLASPVMEKPLEARVARTEQVGIRELVAELWQVAKQYVRDAGLKETSLEYREGVGAIVLKDAAFAGIVPICAITDGQVRPYF